MIHFAANLYMLLLYTLKNCYYTVVQNHVTYAADSFLCVCPLLYLSVEEFFSVMIFQLFYSFI